MDITVDRLGKWMLLWNVWVKGCYFRIFCILSLLICVTSCYGQIKVFHPTCNFNIFFEKNILLHNPPCLLLSLRISHTNLFFHSTQIYTYYPEIGCHYFDFFGHLKAKRLVSYGAKWLVQLTKYVLRSHDQSNLTQVSFAGYCIRPIKGSYIILGQFAFYINYCNLLNSVVTINTTGLKCKHSEFFQQIVVDFHIILKMCSKS